MIKKELTETFEDAIRLALGKPFPNTLLGDEFNPEVDDPKYIAANAEYEINKQIYHDRYENLSEEFYSNRDQGDSHKLLFFYVAATDLSEGIATLKETERHMTEKELGPLYQKMSDWNTSLDDITEQFREYLSKK